jgi:hypothetical protein
MIDPEDRRPTSAIGNMGRDSRTPADLVAVSSKAVMKCWNEAMPRNRIYYLTGNRWPAICAALAVFTAAEICLGIHCYASQAWQKNHSAWKTFDNWLELGNLTAWIEKAREEADRRDQAATRQSSAAARQSLESRAIKELAKRGVFRPTIEQVKQTERDLAERKDGS